MTPEQMAQAITDAGLGWSPMGGLTTLAAADGERCNSIACGSHAALANAVGLTVEQYMPALIALAGDPLADPPVPEDDTVRAAHAAEKKAFGQLLASNGISWSCESGLMLVWRLGARAETAKAPQWDGATVTTQAYRAQANVAGASAIDMAQALADLVGDPTAEPPVEPDSTTFDMIMSA